MIPTLQIIAKKRKTVVGLINRHVMQSLCAIFSQDNRLALLFVIIYRIRNRNMYSPGIRIQLTFVYDVIFTQHRRQLSQHSMHGESVWLPVYLTYVAEMKSRVAEIYYTRYSFHTPL